MASSVVEVEPSIEPLVAGLLGRTLIVPDLDTALSMAAGAFAGWDFVTPAGEILNRLGVFTGGAQGASGKAPASILGRKNQIAELQSEISGLQETLAEAGRRQGALQAEQTALQARLEQVRIDLRQKEVAVATRQGEFNALQTARRSLEARLAQVDRDLDTLAAQEAGNVQKRESLAAQVADWEQREQHATALVAELGGGLEALRSRRDTANQAFNDAKIALATEEQMLASHQRQRGPLETRIRELSAAIERLQTEQGQFEDRRSNLEAGIGQCRREIERLAGEREVLAGQTQQLMGDRKFQEGEIQSREEQLKERRARVAALQNQRSQTEVELAQKTLTLENLRVRLLEKYQVALEDIRPEAVRIQPSDEGLAKVELVPVDVMEQQGWTTDWDAVA
ncbi:MAG: chromosome segregation protein SMC, partial [Verrucomicrobiota bacterium]